MTNKNRQKHIKRYLYPTLIITFLLAITITIKLAVGSNVTEDSIYLSISIIATLIYFNALKKVKNCQ
jgi:hypothetical protein